MFAELITEALRNLMRHKLRSLLTALGIIFGIASVVSMVSAGEGARRDVAALRQAIVRNLLARGANGDDIKAAERRHARGLFEGRLRKRPGRHQGCEHRADETNHVLLRSRRQI